jgi:hypothetical protein
VGDQIYNRDVIILKPKILITILFLLLIIPQPVYAYLDPGFGSMVWQMIAAVLFGAAFTIKIYWQKIKNFFGRNKKE